MHDSLDGDAYVHKLTAYVRRHEVALANGLLLYSKKSPDVKPMRLAFSLHHLYYVSERIDSALDVDVGPLTVRLDAGSHEPTFISFLANTARTSHFDSDARSITSINSVRSIVSSASMYWRSYAAPRVTAKDIRYLYSSFTKIPCLTLCPKTKTAAIAGYEEYPCDTAVPVHMFKNLQVLELVDYDPNEVFGWHVLSEQLRILIVKTSKITSLAEFLFTLVVADESGRTAFASRRKSERNRSKSDAAPFPESRWALLKQLTVTDTSITSVAPACFKPLANLVKLNLSNNLLESVPDGLAQLPHLRYLNLADNYITTLEHLPPNLRHLTTLNLNNNKLTSISGLQDLYCVEKIDLRRNHLASVVALKPVVLLYIKCKKFANVYLASNKLPKGFRVDLFNLINGVQYKNKFKIDDSLPGYFESALLLDAESSFKHFERFFHDSNDCNDPHLESLINPINKLDLDEPKRFDLSCTEAVPKPPSPLATNQNVANKLPDLNLKLKASPTMTSIADCPTAMVTQVQVTARMNT